MNTRIKRTLLLVSLGALSVLLLAGSVAGYSLYRFAHPVPIHIRGADSCPEEARNALAEFHLPDVVEDVYFFSNRQLRGSYYLRCRIPSAEAYAQYKAQITAGKQTRNGDEIPVNPRDEKHIADWWNWRDNADAGVYAVYPAAPDSDYYLDYVIFDDRQRKVYAIWQED